MHNEKNGVKLESVQCVKDLGVSISSNLKFSQQCNDVDGKAGRMLGFKNNYFSFKVKDIILPLYEGQSKIRCCPAKGYENDYIPTS